MKKMTKRVARSALLVEDDLTIAAVVSDHFKQSWFRVTHVRSYKSARSILKSVLFDALLSDTKIPAKDSDTTEPPRDPSLWIKIANEFKRYNPNAQIMWMSSTPAHEVVWKEIADIFLKKPVDSDGLTAFLDKIIFTR